MSDPASPSPRGPRNHQRSFDSPQVVGNILDSLYPLAQSTAIKARSGGNATYTVLQGNQPPVLVALEGSSSATVLNLDELPMNLVSNDTTMTPKIRDLKHDTSPKYHYSEEEQEDQTCVKFNADELRNLEEAFDDLTTVDDKNTGAIATVAEYPGCLEEKTNASALSSLTADESQEFLLTQPTSPQPLIDEKSTGKENFPEVDQENNVPESAVQTSLLNSRYYSYGRPLSTILECRSRESFSGASVYEKQTSHLDATGEFLKLENDFGDTPDKSSSIRSKLPVLSIRHSMPGPRKSHSFLTNENSSGGDSRFPLASIERSLQNCRQHCDSNIQSLQRSAVFGADGGYYPQTAELITPDEDTSSLLHIPTLDFSSLHIQSDNNEVLENKQTALSVPVPTPRSSKRMPTGGIPPLDFSALHASDDKNEVQSSEETLENLRIHTKSSQLNMSTSRPVSIDLAVELNRLQHLEDTTADEPSQVFGMEESFPKTHGFSSDAVEKILQVSSTSSTSAKRKDVPQSGQLLESCTSDLNNCSQVFPADGTANLSSYATQQAVGTFEKEGSAPPGCSQMIELETGNEPLVSQADAKSQHSNSDVAEPTIPQLFASSRCLFWRAAIFDRNCKQKIIIRQNSGGVVQLQLGLTSGADVFTVLDHRGEPTISGSRIINLPPHLSCAVTVVYRPRLPQHWHTGVLSFRLRPSRAPAAKRGTDFSKSQTYSIRLIGYVTGSSLQCSLCCCVDSSTYWTSAFSAPSDDERRTLLCSPAPKTATATPSSLTSMSAISSSTPRRLYAARVVLTNTGLRSAWVLAVARKPLPDNPNDSLNLTRLGTVTIRPERFVVEPNASQDVTVTVFGETRAIEILFYNGDQILRYQCKNMYTTCENMPPCSPPTVLPRPHHRLRSAYVLQPFENDPEDMSNELPSSISERLYNWHAALRDEQRSRPPISLMLYPLLAENADTSFESSCSFLEALGDINQSLILPDTLSTTLQIPLTSPNDGSRRLLSDLTPLSLRNTPSCNLATPPMSHSARRYRQRASINDWLRNGRVSASPKLSSIAPFKSDPVSTPIILLTPDTELIFAPCGLGLYTSSTLQIQLRSTDHDRALTESPLSSPSVRYRPIYIWRLHWTASPILPESKSLSKEAEKEEPRVFRCLIGNQSDATNPGECSDDLPMTAMGGTHHLPFVFRSPNKRPVNDSGTVIVTDQRIRFCQSWRFVFRLTREGNPTEVFSQQEFTIRLIGETIIPAPRRLRLPFDGPSLLRIRGNPALFDKENTQRRVDLVNLSRTDHLCICLGKITSSHFELVKPLADKFMINPRSSVWLIIQYRVPVAQPATSQLQEVIAQLPISWALPATEGNRHPMILELKGTL